MPTDHSSQGSLPSPDAGHAVSAGRLWRNLGPGLITAAVVVGPGTITITSKLGAAVGMSMVWALVITASFMMVFTAMSARIGILNADSILTVVGRHYGRWLAVTIGLLAFVVCAGFQSSNYIACATALSTLTGVGESVWMLVVGGAGVVFVFGARQLYRFLEKAMTALIAVMLLAFLFNLALARPNPMELLRGLVPGVWPGELTGLAIGLSATTFSVIAALYQASLARQKGWGRDDLSVGVREAVVGIGVLFAVSLTIMWTAATVLRGVEVGSAADLSNQLRPLLGPTAVVLFGVGFLAAGFSSVVVNAMVGGALLADGMGWEARLSGWVARVWTTVGMAVGLAAAFYLMRSGSALSGIVIAQKTTILTVPLVAVVLLMLANDPRVVGPHRNRAWQNAVALLAIGALLAMSAYRVKEMLS
ncbi:MAG: Nramp family divalent metal transporter [Verrucomicrobiae bacterium]|nr:Nramp family divalent metal transporter [Verrucomicrobiae bacterium]